MRELEVLLKIKREEGQKGWKKPQPTALRLTEKLTTLQSNNFSGVYQ